MNLNVLFGFDATMLALMKGVVDKLSTQQTQLDRIEGLLGQISQQETMTMATINDVKSKVTAEGDVISGAVTLLNGLSQMLKDAQAQNDPAAVDAVIAQIDQQTQALASAVAANTPAAA